ARPPRKRPAASASISRLRSRGNRGCATPRFSRSRGFPSRHDRPSSSRDVCHRRPPGILHSSSYNVSSSACVPGWLSWIGSRSRPPRRGDSPDRSSRAPRPAHAPVSPARGKGEGPPPQGGSAMADTIRVVEYFYVETPNTPGVGAAMLTTLRDARVNLLAFSGFPSGRRAQIDFVPEDAAAFRAAAKAAKWKVVGPKKAFL